MTIDTTIMITAAPIPPPTAGPVILECCGLLLAIKNAKKNLQVKINVIIFFYKCILIAIMTNGSVCLG